MGGFTPTQEDLAKISASQDNNKMAEKKKTKEKDRREGGQSVEGR